MKLLYPTLAGLLLGSAAAHAQNVGIGTASPNAAAALDITASGKGLLVPRMDSATRAAIAAPVPAGLLVYQTDKRTGFWYYTGAAWAFIPDRLRSGDNLGNHTATQALALNNNQLRLRAATDNNHVLTYNSTYDGPLLYGYSGGALGYTTNGTTITPALRWTSGNNVAVGLAGTNSGSGPDLSFGGSGYGEGIGSARANNSPNIYGLDLYTSSIRRLSISNDGTVSVGVAGTNTGTAPDLAFGGSGTGEGIGSARGQGNPNQYGLDFYTNFYKRLSIANSGNVGIGTSAPNSTLQVAGSLAVGVVRGQAGGAGAPGTALANAGYYGLDPTSGGPYYQLPDPTTCQGRLYYLRNNASNGSTGAILTTAGGSFYDGTSSSAGSTYGLSATGSSKTVTAISDGLNWTIIKSGN